MEPTNMSNLTTFCKQLLHYVSENPDHVFTDLSGIVDVENQITKQMESLPAGDLDMSTTVSLYLSILNHVYNFQTNSGRRQHNQTPKLLELQDSLIRLSKLNLKLQNISKTFELNMTSVSITVGDGGALQEKYTTAYGRVILENIENLRQNLASQKLMIMVISYKENLFCRSQTPDHINIPVMTTVAFDDDGRNLSDVNFLMGFPVSSNLDTANSSLDMKFNGTHYMAAFPGGFFNSASALVSADISMMESCEIYGKYGTTSPTYKDFDFYLQTNGLISVTKYRPYNFLFSFVEGIVQLPITQTPVIIIAQCQAGENTKQGGVPYLQIHKVLSQVIEGQASCWKSSKSLQLAGGRKSEITLKSFFFGTFSASIKLIPPDEIDFQAVFLNFSEKLNDTPYVLATVLAVLIALVIATPLLRKQDCIDYALWSYERLIDNKPDSTFDYYICVSTGVRSKRQMEALVYINIIGTRGETGARLLAGNNRKNFSNGTSCNFFMKSDIFLGNIKTVKIWLGGNIKSQSWYLSKIIIIDEKTRNAIQLKCNKWLSLEKGTGRSWRTLRAGKKTDNASSLSEISTRNLFDDHLWFSLLFRPRYSRFTRVQRLWSIVSLLFLSMVASAMFYDTPDDTLPFLNVGNFELGYKEIYTGLMSSIITVVPSLIITFVFSKRKVLGEKPLSISNNGDTVGSSGSLPWWSIFLAYTLLLLCIISGSFFTLLYSLEWGPSLTVKWMSSFFLGSTQSAIIIDPAKAIILAILLVCLCSEKNNRSDFYLPPTSVVDKQQEFAGQGHCNRRVADCPCDEPETRAQKKRRYTLHMDRKLNRLLRRFVFGVLYACMVLLIGTQQKVSEVYGQNKHLKNVLKPTQEVEQMEDVWQYLNKVVLQRLYPSEFSSGEIKSLNELRFIGDYYKMGPIRLRQIRVTGTCTTPSLMKKHGIACIPDYDTDTEDTNDYTEGWITTNMSASLNDYTASYRYHHNLKETPTYTGHFGTYGVGGYLVDLDVLPTKANDIVNRLRRNVWLDEQTRAFFIEACLVNRNNMIFTHIQVVFEFPSTGGIFTDTTVVSSNLYPYTHTFDYIILFLQILFSFTILVRFVLVVAKIIKTQGHSLLTMSQAIEIVHLGVSVATVVCLVLRFTSTIAVLNTLRQEMGFYTSFGYVFQWDGYFSLSLGMVTFLAILDLLKHLQFNYQIFLAYKTITAFRRELFNFTLALSVLIVGFASLINLIYGPTERGFRSIISAILTLFRMTIGMIKFRNDIDVPALDIFVMFAIYALVTTLAFVNLLTSSLNAHITHIKQLIRDGKTPFDWYLSRHFWNRLTGLFTVCGVARPRNRRKKVS
ncbi:polycystic kidney disease protein 1-like 2 [Mizuhopecten yessoensis]|uniref:polycystic kidney disease protein 1-like 2 n=1 Tax=Mizuhopecten yessoensis TaxID=6573 RepID=UPI000B4575D1|nr:polycystic kidney disease protein 1-like 2 [Mizuhopecten yessoensis]